jgi:hypothetical protein
MAAFAQTAAAGAGSVSCPALSIASIGGRCDGLVIDQTPSLAPVRAGDRAVVHADVLVDRAAAGLGGRASFVPGDVLTGMISAAHLDWLRPVFAAFVGMTCDLIFPAEILRALPARIWPAAFGPQNSF